VSDKLNPSVLPQAPEQVEIFARGYSFIVTTNSLEVFPSHDVAFASAHPQTYFVQKMEIPIAETVEYSVTQSFIFFIDSDSARGSCNSRLPYGGNHLFQEPRKVFDYGICVEKNEDLSTGGACARVSSDGNILLDPSIRFDDPVRVLSCNRQRAVCASTIADYDFERESLLNVGGELGKNSSKQFLFLKRRNDDADNRRTGQAASP
jgi:hypothetical protein